MKYLFLLLISNCFLQLNAQYQIGHTTITYIDASRSNRSIATEIYYPALTAGNNTTAAAGQFPVIVFGHGFVMAWELLSKYLGALYISRLYFGISEN